jgi:hypothetical protein
MLAIILLAGLAVIAPAADQGAIDYQKTADGARWGWRLDHADPIQSIWMSQRDFTYTVRSGRDVPAEMEFAVSLGGKQLIRWSGFRHSVFIVRSAVLYYAETPRLGEGGTIIAFDLKKGAELWREKIEAAKPREIMMPGIVLLNLEAMNDEVLTIWGNDTFGRYLEFKDIRSGKTLGYHVFTDAEVRAATQPVK